MTMVLQAAPSRDHLTSDIISAGETSLVLAQPDQDRAAPEFDVWGTEIEDGLDEIQKKITARLECLFNNLKERIEQEVEALVKLRVQEYLEEREAQPAL